MEEFEINELRAKLWKTTSRNENRKFLLWRQSFQSSQH